MKTYILFERRYFNGDTSFMVNVCNEDKNVRHHIDLQLVSSIERKTLDDIVDSLKKKGTKIKTEP